MHSEEDPEIEELRAQVAHDRRARQALAAYPDCRDPDHPGCPCCEEQPEDEDEMEEA